MDMISETPSKKRKLDDGSAQASQGYDSEFDDGDDLFKQYETVATLPLPKRLSQGHDDIGLQSALSHTYVTQPTQIITSPSLQENSKSTPSRVQVPASSPLSAQTTPGTSTKSQAQGGRIASTIAPPGCSFRPPPGITSRPQAVKPSVIDLDDDGPVHHPSSDDDTQTNPGAYIKPSAFVEGSARALKPIAGLPVNRFGASISRFAYDPQDTSKSSSLSGSVFDIRDRDDIQSHFQFSVPKQSTDTMANAYGATTRHRPAQPQQKLPAKAAPIHDLELDDIADYQVRSKIMKMQAVLPSCSVSACQRALITKRNNYDDALDFLVNEEEKMVDLTISDGEDPLASHVATQKKAPAKQQVKVKQNIQEKWTSTQKVAREPQLPPLDPVSSPVIAPSKPRRRLVQGRRKSSSPVQPPAPPIRRAPSVPSLDSDETDSGVDVESQDTELESKVLHFINTCGISDLADMATITEDIASLVLSRRPFKLLEDVKRVSAEEGSTKKKVARKAIGDKIVDKCLDMWAGYEAVDELVRRCEEISKPLKEDMKAWGVDIYGNDELEITNVSRDVSCRDSGIGTPASFSVSDTDGEGDTKGSRTKSGFFPQPLAMAEDVQLKDYQLVGVNWLSLLFKRGLSSILADDMGLGKTIQVIGFLAHLQETGIKGPHLVVVPSSTLENWLKEFKMFCPQLFVTPYYANQNERPGIRAEILDIQDSVDVIVTTYALAKVKDDNKFLRKLKPTCVIYDEGHQLKNPKSKGYDYYMQIPSQFRLLLTGTPLQNNLKELAALLGFILPSVFEDHKESLEAIFSHKAKTTDTSHTALLSDQRVARAKSMLTPFILRRKKHQVLNHLPAKHHKIEFCDLSPSQVELYDETKARAQKIIADRAAGIKTGSNSTNIMMYLRQTCNHPMLFRRMYKDSVLSKMSKELVKKVRKYHVSDPTLVWEDFSVMSDMELLHFWYVHDFEDPFFNVTLVHASTSNTADCMVVLLA